MPRLRTLSVHRVLRVLAGLGLLLGVVMQAGPLPTARAAGAFTGQVFQDFNDNGVRDTTTTITNDGAGNVGVAVDRGVAGITVTVYDSGNNNVGSDTTAADGTYLINATGVAPYRVEFTNLPAGYEPGAQGTNNGTTVRFVNTNGASGIDLGINRPSDFCQNNPLVVTNCYVFGDQVNGPNNTRPTIVSFPYSAGSPNVAGIDNPASHSVSLRANQVGTTWGLAWARTTRRLYAASFFKGHAGYGPGEDGVINTADDPAAIYVIDPASNTVADVFTVPGITVNGHDTADYIADAFNTTWAGVGQTSLGGLALSDDDTTLYVMNLENRRLYALNATTGAVITSQPVPLSLPLQALSPVATCPAGDVRPFAVSYHLGKVYVGLTCTAQSSADADSFTDSNANGRYDPQVPEPFVDGDGNGVYTLNGDARQLQAFVYEVDPATLAFGASPIFTLRLDYPRALVETGSFGHVEWLPWVPAFNGTVGSSTALVIYPQPWLTDITFDTNGDLLLGVRDRLGDLTGARGREDPTPGSIELIALSGGDTLRACASGGTWTLEANGRCGGAGAAPQNTGEGPGGGEYYFEDYYAPYHDEVHVGGLLQIAGFPDLLSAVFDPIFIPAPNATPNVGTFDGGIRWNANADGSFVKGYRLFDGGNAAFPAEPSFGKAASLGDLVAFCDAAPIEIGNRVWLDTDKDGQQDPEETPIAGVTVRLYAPNGTLLATAVTNASGEYYFSSATGSSSGHALYGITGLTFNTTGYTVRLDNPSDYTGGGPLAGLSPTLVDNLPGANGDSRDSDGLLVGGFPRTTVNTGGPGANRHTYDFGFATNPTAVELLYFRVDHASAGTVTLSWATAAEIDNFGFRLYRAPSENWDQAVQVRFVPSSVRASGGQTGATYTVTDYAPGSGPWWYWLVDVSVTGVERVHAPVTTAFGGTGGLHQLFLPAIRR